MQVDASGCVWDGTLDDGGLDEAIDEDADGLEIAAPPAAPDTSDHRPREPLLPLGGSLPTQTADPQKPASAFTAGITTPQPRTVGRLHRRAQGLVPAA